MKKYKISIIILLIFTITSCFYYSAKKEKIVVNTSTPISVYREDFNQSLQDLKNKNIEIDATYADGASSLEDMKGKADKIVDGVVESQVQYSPVSVESTLSVKANIKGKEFHKVKIYQIGVIGDPEVLQLDKEYVLCLGNQGKSDENIYYIKGGIQGVFLIDNEKIVTYDSIMKNDIIKLVNSKETLKNDSKSQYNLLIQFLSK